MTNGRSKHTANLLADGKVLLVEEGRVRTFMTQLRRLSRLQLTHRPIAPAHAAVNLNDGTVLVTGGYVGKRAAGDAWIYDPVSQTFTQLVGPHEDSAGKSSGHASARRFERRFREASRARARTTRWISTTLQPRTFDRFGKDEEPPFQSSRTALTEWAGTGDRPGQPWRLGFWLRTKSGVRRPARLP